MEVYAIHLTIIVILLIVTQEIHSTKDGDEVSSEKANISNIRSNQSPTVGYDGNEIGDVNRSKASINENLSRVKRQYSYDPYSRRNRYPYPVPIFIGGGLGIGGPGIGGRGFGGRGFGGRGFGGRGFGGRGIGGRGIGGFGGRGIGGGGRGGRG